jgi:hypothetical protein
MVKYTSHLRKRIKMQIISKVLRKKRLSDWLLMEYFISSVIMIRSRRRKRNEES